jgi:hypothetical protein
MVHNQGPARSDAPKSRQPRPTVRISAVLHAHGMHRRIEITEYSEQGLSLRRVSGIELDERVTVELQSGQRLPLRVIWAKGDQADVRFLGPIAPGHTVMRWLDQAARRYERRRSSSSA